MNNGPPKYKIVFASRLQSLNEITKYRMFQSLNEKER